MRAGSYTGLQFDRYDNLLLTQMKSCSWWMYFLHSNRCIEIISWRHVSCLCLRNENKARGKCSLSTRKQVSFLTRNSGEHYFNGVMNAIDVVDCRCILEKVCREAVESIWCWWYEFLFEESGKFLKSFHNWKKLQLNEGVSCLRILACEKTTILADYIFLPSCNFEVSV